MSISPLFILGVPRSGTTFLHQLINAHEEVFITDELRLMSWLYKEVDKIKAGFNEYGNPYPFNYGAEFSNYLKGNAGHLFSPFFINQASKIGKENIKYWGDKYPHYNECLNDINVSFPRAKFIFIYRDLKDVVCSVKKGHDWTLDKSIEYVKTIYFDYCNKINSLKDTGKLHSNNFIYVDYEELIFNPEEIINVFNKLDLKITSDLENKIEYLKGIQSHSNRKNSSAVFKFNAKEESVNRWKKDLSKSDQIKVKKAFKDSLLIKI